MSDLTRLDAAAMAAALAAREVSAVELTQAHLDRIAEVDGPVEAGVHAFLHVDGEGALARAAELDADRARGEELHPLAGVPVAVKDVMVTRGLPSTAGSRMLEGWIPPYDATVVEKMHAAGLVTLGKTNMDEFAMGSSTEHSAFGPTRNPWAFDRIPGGSGGGSAAALAAFEAPLATGTDTGGSIRQPAALTGTVGVKPTYGGVSRYGLIALASSLDQGGPCARTVLDTALLHEVMGGHDPRDSTSLKDPVPAVVAAAREGARGDLTGVRVGVVAELGGTGHAEGFQSGVLQRFAEALDHLRAAGAEVVEVSCPSLEHALGAYYLILPSEASSNLARYDGMRYGLRVMPDGVHPSEVTAEQVMAATRAKGFGAEAKRRIILGTYALSSGYYDAYYGSAQKIRTLVQRDFNAAFEQVDVLVSPTAPTTAFTLGEKLDDPLAMYLGDVATIPANLAGIPGMSLPVGLAPEDGLPVGLQLLAPVREDARLYRVGAALEARLKADWGGLLLDRIPAWTPAPTIPATSLATTAGASA
ncbi:aspartyl/glutamyl-tRNA(Asn/Gln) amidotransferase subunit A [Quadrisphaera granulorum]|uniref:Glutamyl-tRNA(Gln) amidotransferase subunit A n=1 Tax=Quadrisphaera granulorum TaxID=317664 RepID=A0A316AHB0_9ACTN|nr:Asp-tRNA(Asn)/Glu-tRNA(Gln) amidotransferase subunit GatA [Quadrisphaera granulorum]PWJ56320.1 aspartyl/glutamyl-tRNA(Asn/Gln) amidotransferase subunit A [Quadrisphaera granulorum]SZE94954.1 aspartyl/glutamyl-tRNA(Asn/Gln) amidotransferase subunit A [Quadrisphaera granulorum]